MEDGWDQKNLSNWHPGVVVPCMTEVIDSVVNLTQITNNLLEKAGVRLIKNSGM